MPSLASGRSYADFLFAIRRYVRASQSLTVEGAKEQIKNRLQNREQMFLEMVRSCIYDHPASPYLPLLRAADCEFGDIQKSVGDHGIEQTLTRLRNDGVFFTFEEFKGRSRVERSGVAFDIHPDDFASPVAKRHIATQTGGSTGAPIRGWMNMDNRGGRLPNVLIAYAAYGLLGVHSVMVEDAEPSSMIASFGLSSPGPVMERRYAPRGRRRGIEAWRYGMVRRSLAAAVRMAGASLAKVEWIDPQDLLPVARWAEQTLRQWGSCLIWAGVSSAVRIGIAAAENGIDLHGASIQGNDEPPTPAKVREITRTGAKWIPVYGGNETGYVGEGCAYPIDGTDVHLMTDRVAVVQIPRKVPGSSLQVNAYNFTTLWTVSPYVLLNVELDDFGILERRSCGCLFEELGLDSHLREIYSFRKLTGEGVTLVGSDMMRILEEVLPSRFGGTPLDYQLMEEEDEQSFTRLALLIHPRLQIPDETLVIKTVLEELKSGDGASSMAGTVWAQSESIQVRRMEPVATGSGKLLPLHVSRRLRELEPRRRPG